MRGVPRISSDIAMLRCILLGIIFVSLVPFPQKIAPAWTIEVVDAAGLPQSGIVAREIWQEYSLERRNHEEDVRTGPNGLASFPRRTIWRPYIANALGAVWNILTQGVHASFGPKVYVVAFGDNRSVFTGNPSGSIPQRVVLSSGVQ